MIGRDPHEPHRVSTPLELLFDLTFVISFGFAASQFAHAFSEGHFKSALLGFALASYGICLAWINFSWFASAYDTDDWVYRLCTMVQMIGVLVFATGLPGMFASMEKVQDLNNPIMVGGYVIMRVAMIFQWLRAAKDNEDRRSTCLTYAGTIFLAQIGWVLRVFFTPSFLISTMFFFLLAIFEFAGPYIAEKKHKGTPWHTHHIVERYSLFAIIALGEGLVGAASALSAVVEHQGWTINAALIGLAGVSLTFSIWWVYFTLPSAQILHKQRHKFLVWSSLQIVLVISIVAIGAGLDIAALFLEGKASIGNLPSVLTVAVPVAIFLCTIFSLKFYLTKNFDRFQFALILTSIAIYASTIIAAAFGLNMAICLLLLVLVPSISIFGHEYKTYENQL